MKPQFDNQVLSSFLLWFDHTLLKDGEAYQNTTGQFYNVLQEFAGYQTFASSYSQIVSDASITGATIPTGLYVGSNLVDVGEGGATGLYAIDYNNNISYLTPEEISALNEPIGQFTGTRAVTGSATMYLRAGELESSGFLRNLLNDLKILINQFYIWILKY